MYAEDTAESLGNIIVGGGVLRGLVVDDVRGCLYGVVGGGVGVWGIKDGCWRGLMEGGGWGDVGECVMYVEGGYLYVGGSGLWVWDLEEGVAVRELSVVGGEGGIKAMIRVGECLWVGREDGCVGVYGIFGSVDEGVDFRGEVFVGGGGVCKLVGLGGVVAVGSRMGGICLVCVESLKVVERLSVEGLVWDLAEVERRAYDKVVLIAAGFEGDLMKRIEKFVAVGDDEDERILDVVRRKERGLAVVGGDENEIVKGRERMVGTSDDGIPTSLVNDIDPSIAVALQINLDRMASILADVVSSNAHEGKENLFDSGNTAANMPYDGSVDRLTTELRVAKQLLKLCSSKVDNDSNTHIDDLDKLAQDSMADGELYHAALGIELQALQREKQLAEKERDQVVQEMNILRRECDATVTSMEKVLREVANKAEEAEKKEKTCRQTLARSCDELLGQAVEVGQEATQLELVAKEVNETKDQLQAVTKERQMLETKVATLKGKLKINDRRSKEKVENLVGKLKDSEKQASVIKKELAWLKDENIHLKSTKKRFDQVVREKDLANAEIESLRQKLIDAEQKSIEDLMARKKEISSSREEKEALSGDLESISKENTLLKSAAQLFEKEITTSRESRQKLQDALEMIERSEAEKDAALRLQRVKTRELEHDFDLCRTDLASMKRHREALSAELVTCMRDKENECSEKKKSRKEVEELGQLQDELKKKMASLQDDLMRATSESRDTEKELLETKSSLKLSEESRITAEEEKAKAVRGAEIMRRERDELKEECAKLKSEITCSQETILGLMKDIESLEAGKETENNTPSPAHDKASKRLSESLSSNRVQLDQLTMQLAEGEREKARAEACISTLNEELRQLRECHEREKVEYEKSLLDTKFECQKSEARLAALLSEIESTKQERDEAAQQLLALQDKLTNIAKQCQEYEDRSALCEHELSAQTDALVALSRSAANTDTEKHGLQVHINRLEAENQRLTSELSREFTRRQQNGGSTNDLGEGSTNSDEQYIRRALESAKRETVATEAKLEQLSTVARRYRAVAQTHRDSLPILVALDSELQRLALNNEACQPRLLQVSNAVADLVSLYYSEEDKRHSNAVSERYVRTPDRQAAMVDTLATWKLNGANRTTTNDPNTARGSDGASSSIMPSRFAAWTPRRLLRF